MFIKEVCKICNLTKKALEYYEAKGLVSPQVLENGYRDYSENDIAVLKEIAVLRQCGIGIGEIGEILHSRSKAAALEKYSYVNHLQAQRISRKQQCLARLIDTYDISGEFLYLQEHMQDDCTIKERMALAFPGSYGVFLALHFGRFLEITIDTDQKRAAYETIIRCLDSMESYLTPELSELLEELFCASEKVGTAKLEQMNHENMSKVIADPETYLQQNHEIIEEYLAYKMSEEFKNSPAGKLQQALLTFQEQSGYREVLLENIKAISPDYAAYTRQLTEVNERFYSHFPQSRKLYEKPTTHPTD